MPYIVGKAVDRIDFARASGGSYVDNTGDLRMATSNVLRFTHDPVTRERLGALAEPARANKCTNYSANPANLTGLSISHTDGDSAVTVASDNAAIIASGLDKVCTTFKAIRLEFIEVDIVTLQFSGATGNTNPHIASAYVRGDGGRIGITGASGPEGEVAFGPSEMYRRVFSDVCTPDSNARVMQITAEGSGVIWILLNQLEEGNVPTSVIPVSGAQASRAEDVISFDLQPGDQQVTVRFLDGAPHSYVDQVTSFTIPTNLDKTLLNSVLVLSEPPEPLSLVLDPTDGDIVPAQVGVVYPGFTVIADGGSLPYTFSISSGALPPGLTLVQTATNKARVQGTPTASGTFAGIVIQVKDSA